MSSPLPPLPTPQNLAEHLSTERFQKYLDGRANDYARAMALYEWNSSIAAAFFESMGHCEVFMRSAMHEQLSAWHFRNGRTGEWYDDPAGVLGVRRHEEIAKAREYIRRRRMPEVPGQVVAQLGFGFWRFMLDASTQTTLWAPAIRCAFPHLVPQRRETIYQLVDPMHNLRNRIAHHEPIHDRPLDRRYEDLLVLVGYIDPALRTWLAHNSQVPRLLTQRPA